MIFFQINGRSVASPKDLSHSYVELDKMERTMDGTMVVDIVGFKKKIDVSWDYLTKEDMLILNTEIKQNSFVTVSYQDTLLGTLSTFTAKPQGFSYSPGYDWVKDKVIWKNVSVSFEEK